MSAKVIVACGSGVATSQTVASKVDRLLKEARINADVQAVDLKSVDRHLEGAAAYITIVRETKQRDIPVINGIGLLGVFRTVLVLCFRLPSSGPGNRFRPRSGCDTLGLSEDGHDCISVRSMRQYL